VNGVGNDLSGQGFLVVVRIDVNGRPLLLLVKDHNAVNQGEESVVLAKRRVVAIMPVWQGGVRLGEAIRQDKMLLPGRAQLSNDNAPCLDVLAAKYLDSSPLRVRLRARCMSE
jgi:hypothetical protein